MGVLARCFFILNNMIINGNLKGFFCLYGQFQQLISLNKINTPGKGRNSTNNAITIVRNAIHVDLNIMHTKVKMMKNPFSKVGSFIFGNCYQLEREHCQQADCNYINTNTVTIMMVK